MCSNDTHSRFWYTPPESSRTCTLEECWGLKPHGTRPRGAVLRYHVLFRDNGCSEMTDAGIYVRLLEILDRGEDQCVFAVHVCPRTNDVRVYPLVRALIEALRDAFALRVGME